VVEGGTVASRGRTIDTGNVISPSNATIARESDIPWQIVQMETNHTDPVDFAQSSVTKCGVVPRKLSVSIVVFLDT
jgi:hypothetical protein